MEDGLLWIEKSFDFFSKDLFKEMICWDYDDCTPYTFVGLALALILDIPVAYGNPKGAGEKHPSLSEPAGLGSRFLSG